MISALFYPKELKDVIADLKAKGDLNEKALRTYMRFVGIQVVAPVSLLSVLFHFVVIGHPIITALTFIGVIFFVLRFYFKRVWLRSFRPYFSASDQKGRLDKIKHCLDGSMMIFFDDNPEVVMHIALTGTLEFSKDQEIEYLVWDNYAAPLIEQYMDKFCLKASLVRLVSERAG